MYHFVQELLGQMSRIREKATESEAVVRNITKEIQVLDLAKKNLQLSMTTLKRLQMLGELVRLSTDTICSYSGSERAWSARRANQRKQISGHSPKLGRKRLPLLDHSQIFTYYRLSSK